jgi:hypothetical protein
MTWFKRTWTAKTNKYLRGLHFELTENKMSRLQEEEEEDVFC